MIWKMAVPALVLAAAVACTPLPNQFRRGQLNIRKECSTFAGRAGDICTITSSNLADLPAGTVITYASAAVAGSLDVPARLPLGDPMATGQLPAGLRNLGARGQELHRGIDALGRLVGPGSAFPCHDMRLLP